MGETRAATPVEYEVAVERYLTAAELSSGSRRVYRIALSTWAWLLVDRPVPPAGDRRRAAPPALPLALLDGPRAHGRLEEALARRRAATRPRTLNRELVILRGALSWWRAQGWISGDPASALRSSAVAEAAQVPLPEEDLGALFALRVPLREKVTWHLLHETGAAVREVLALDVDHLDLPGRSTRPSAGRTLRWRSGTARYLPLLVTGRTAGPLLLTDRRAPRGTAAADVCPYTGRARLSYRRAAELFTESTRPLDPAGRGWTLGQLRWPRR